MKFLFKHKYEIVLFLLFISYVIYFTAATFLKYDNFYMGRFDLGNMAQTVWNTHHGRIFTFTDPNGVDNLSRLAFHADFMLIFISPLYYLWEDPRILLLTQTLVIAFGGIFVYLISKEILNNKLISLVLSFSFYIYPAVNYVNLFDFHAVSFTITLFLAAFYFILKRKYSISLIFLFLAGITKEEVWVVNAIFGIYLTFQPKQRNLGILVFLVSSLVFYFLIWQAIPKALGGNHFALSFYRDFGDNPTQVIKTLILSPHKVLPIILEQERLDYIKKLFIPLGYMSFLSPQYLIFALPDLAIDLLSKNKVLHQIYYQYSSTIIPFVFISTMFSPKKMSKAIPMITFKTLSFIILLTAVSSAYSFGPLLFAKKPQDQMFKKPLEKRWEVDNFIRSIPTDSKVSATNNLGSKLSHREYIYEIPNGIERSDYILFLLKSEVNQSIKSAQSYYLKVKDSEDYKLVYSVDNFYAFKKN